MACPRDNIHCRVCARRVRLTSNSTCAAVVDSVVVEEERSHPHPTRTPSEEFEATSSEPIFMGDKFTKTPPPRTLSRVSSWCGDGGESNGGYGK